MNRVATLLNEADDEEIVRLLREGDLNGAKLLVAVHGRDAVEALRSYFGPEVSGDVLDLAVCQAAALLLHSMKRVTAQAGIRALFFITARFSVARIQGNAG